MLTKGELGNEIVKVFIGRGITEPSRVCSKVAQELKAFGVQGTVRFNVDWNKQDNVGTANVQIKKEATAQYQKKLSRH